MPESTGGGGEAGSACQESREMPAEQALRLQQC